VEQTGGSHSFVSGLRVIWAERDFRKLFATRLVSQAGDGVFNAGFAAYAFFSAESFPNPTAAVYAFAVLYLPYSLIGPFAGVFIDRWSRRQVLVWSALVRACLVALAGFVVLAGQTGVPLYISALAVLGVNRFFLSAVSAGVPHVVSPENLVIANAVAPTAGTILGFVGGTAGLGIHYITGGGHGGSAATLMTGGVCYLVAGLLALRMRRDLLGPDKRELAESAGDELGLERSITGDLADVVRGLAAGLKHLGQRRRAAYAMGAVGAHRMMYGILLVTGLLLYRNYFYPSANGNNALNHAAGLLITSAIGFGAAAITTPPMVRRFGKDTTIFLALALGGVAVLLLGTPFNQIGFLVLGAVMGLSAQSVKICADTTVQEQVDDAYLGRVFSLYDMLYNVSYVVGPAIAAAFLPVTGKSYPVVLAIAAAYLAAAIVYWMLTRNTDRTAVEQIPSRETTVAAPD
jgi:MFS family permease